MIKRSSGVLMHISSLPGPFATGTLGREACKFAELLVKMGCSYWQILPINHLAEGNSPYTNCSLFAINPNFIDLYALGAKGLLTADEINDVQVSSRHAAQDNPSLEKKRMIMLRKAFSRIGEPELKGIAAFSEAHAHWLDAYALFTVLKNNYGDAQWNEWPVIGLRLHKRDAVAQANIDYGNDILFWKFVQYTAYGQWAEFRKYVNGLGVSIVGDIPIYASFDSSDVWANNHLFQLNTKHIPKRVGGVPPDYFNKNGQLWGNPLYDWDEMKKDGYAWWLSRIENALTIFDLVRIDHFRGLHTYWAVPYANKTAKKGEWLKGPGMDLIKRINARFDGAPFIMEDLGAISRPVQKFFDSTGYPGMRVMQFGFGPDGDPVHKVKNFTADCVAYTGTHDNNTIIGWYGDVPAEKRAASYAELGLAAQPDKPFTNAEICRAWIGKLFESKAALAIVPIQDLLYEGAEARMNTPGTTIPENWTYRVTKETLDAMDIGWVTGLNRKYKRRPGDDKGEKDEKVETGEKGAVEDKNMLNAKNADNEPVKKAKEAKSAKCEPDKSSGAETAKKRAPGKTGKKADG